MIADVPNAIPPEMITQILGAGSVKAGRLTLARWIDGIVTADRVAYALQVGNELRQYLLCGGAIAEVRPPLGLTDSVTGRAIRRSEPIRVDDTRDSTGADMAAFAEAGLRSSMHIPLVHCGRAYAALVFAHHSVSAFSPSDVSNSTAAAALLDASQRLNGLIPVIAETAPDRRALAARLGAPPVRDSRDQRSLLRAALHQGDIESHFQAVFRYPGHEVLSLEALARWRQADGVTAAEQFLPNASGLRERVTLDVARGAGELIEGLREAGADAPPVMINVGSAELDAMVEWYDVGRPVRTTALFEVPASDAAADYGGLRARLAAATTRGLEFVLDDVMEPPNGLVDLFALPIAGVKLDKRLTHAVVDSDEAQSRIGQIVAAAQRRGLHVTAKGVETSEQAEVLSSLGIRRMQGYYFLPPLDQESMIGWLKPSRRAMAG